MAEWAGPEQAEADGVEREKAVRAFLLAACPPEILLDLALHADREGQMMLDAALQGELPAAYEVAEYRRRRAAVWARLAEQHPEREDIVGQAYVERVAWQLAEVRHTEEAVIRATGGESR